MSEAAGTRLYARRIIPFFILFSVVALRADLALVSARKGCVSPKVEVAAGAAHDACD